MKKKTYFDLRKGLIQIHYLLLIKKNKYLHLIIKKVNS